MLYLTAWAKTHQTQSNLILIIASLTLILFGLIMGVGLAALQLNFASSGVAILVLLGMLVTFANLSPSQRHPNRYKNRFFWSCKIATYSLICSLFISIGQQLPVSIQVYEQIQLLERAQSTASIRPRTGLRPGAPYLSQQQSFAMQIIQIQGLKLSDTSVVILLSFFGFSALMLAYLLAGLAPNSQFSINFLLIASILTAAIGFVAAWALVAVLGVQKVTHWQN